MRSFVLMAICLATFAMSGCATVVRGTTEEVKFDSTPQGAKMTTEPLGLSCITPCAIEFKRRQEFTAKFELNGETREVFVESDVAGKGVAGSVVGNALLGGVIGVGIDAASGAMLSHFPNPVVVDFTTEGSDDVEQPDAVKENETEGDDPVS